MYKKYSERNQLKHRKKYGKIEKRSELIERLKKKKEEKEQIKKAKEEISQKTGKEYLFKYHSVKKDENGELVSVIKDSDVDLKKKEIFVDKEIARVENKLKEFTLKIKPNKIIFDEEGNPIKKECDSLLAIESKEKREYEEYLKELIETKRKISRIIEN